MVSHNRNKSVPLSVSIAGGLRFRKRPSAFNIAVGKCMKSKGSKPTNGGRYDREFQADFIDCVRRYSR